MFLNKRIELWAIICTFSKMTFKLKKNIERVLN